jgi:hypothetical protein
MKPGSSVSLVEVGSPIFLVKMSVPFLSLSLTNAMVSPSSKKEGEYSQARALVVTGCTFEPSAPIT